MNENNDIINPLTRKIFIRHNDYKGIVEYINSQQEVINGFTCFCGLNNSEEHLNYVYNKLEDMVMRAEKNMEKAKELEDFRNAEYFRNRRNILMEIRGLLIDGKHFEEDSF